MDFHDATVYKILCERYGGHENMKDGKVISVSTDGFQTFSRKSYDVWPIAGILCNPPPHLRFCVKNALPLAFIPGPNEPINLQSFLKPLLSGLMEINSDGGTLLRFFDGLYRSVRVHMIWFTGYLPAIKKCAGLKEHNRNRPCRFCMVEGM